jgi:hypothetical protein
LLYTGAIFPTFNNTYDFLGVLQTQSDQENKKFKESEILTAEVTNLKKELDTANTLIAELELNQGKFESKFN